jgi:hypothetical protein
MQPWPTSKDFLPTVDKNLYLLKGCITKSQPSQALPKKEEFMPLNCTFEVTQRFLYIIVTLLHKINEFGVKGVSGGLDLCHSPAIKVVRV